MDKEKVLKALEVISEQVDVPIWMIIGELTGTVFDEEEAGDLKDRIHDLSS